MYCFMMDLVKVVSNASLSTCCASVLHMWFFTTHTWHGRLMSSAYFNNMEQRFTSFSMCCIVHRPGMSKCRFWITFDVYIRKVDQKKESEDSSNFCLRPFEMANASTIIFEDYLMLVATFITFANNDFTVDSSVMDRCLVTLTRVGFPLLLQFTSSECQRRQPSRCRCLI